MPHPDLAIVTGAFSYTGRYVARRLLDQGVKGVLTAGNPPIQSRSMIAQSSSWRESVLSIMARRAPAI